MDQKAFPRYYQDSSTQLQIKLISTNFQYVVQAYRNGKLYQYGDAMESVKENTIAILESQYFPSSEAVFLEKLTEVLDHHDKVKQQLAEKLANKI